jgi:hypothetical protein
MKSVNDTSDTTLLIKINESLTKCLHRMGESKQLVTFVSIQTKYKTTMEIWKAKSKSSTKTMKSNTLYNARGMDEVSFVQYAHS